MLTGRLFVLSDYSQRAEVNEERETSAAAAAAWKEEEVSYVHLTECCDSFDELRWHKQKGVIAIIGEWVSECECECEWAWQRRGHDLGHGTSRRHRSAVRPTTTTLLTLHTTQLRVVYALYEVRATPALRAYSVLARGESEPVGYQHSHQTSSIFPSRQFIDTDDAMKCSLQQVRRHYLFISFKSPG